ncbi:hypothetical protein ABGB14_38150 [Nonomuraea sp. B10E15]|uniref:hypothetical protein n=1 Tax=Nonomuraea sp. B10E15 TaxID=3153560 RepID=UPI00325E3146
MIFRADIIPNYLVVKAFGLLDSYWSLIIPVLASAFNVVVMRNFFMLNDSSKWPIQLVLNSYVLQGASSSSMNNTEMYNLPSSQSVQISSASRRRTRARRRY